ncbi:MAG: flagellar hook-associated protein FlgK [Planctomycetaceae bacterium]|jgi:flagellar hook-associated protein 1 FlgK|nr:flagellar hook-associated protein FlgK [Planctomycetaceae bacterium]
MYLFDTLHQASYALSASQLGLQVSGQNLNNVETPGYARESLILETGTSRRLGSGNVVGTGVRVAGIVQVIDNFLEERLRNSTSNAFATGTQEKFYTQLEALLNETTDTDLSSSINAFFNSIDNVLNHPEDVAYRAMTAEAGVKLVNDINRLDKAVADMQRDVNQAVNDAAGEINRLLSKIDALNKNITLTETKSGSQAVGLRDERLNALSELSNYIQISTKESSQTKGVTIYCGSDILLTDGFKAEVKVGAAAGKTVDDVIAAQLCIGDEMSPLDVRSGFVAGLYSAHQTILGGYRKQLNAFAGQLVQTFNEIYASGQGLTGYSELTSLAKTENPDAVIEGLENGGFYIQIYNKKTGTTTETYIEVKADGTPKEVETLADMFVAAGKSGTSYNDIAAAINAIDGLTATVNSVGELEIHTDNADIDFGFANDTSGALSKLGLNTFFTGTKAGSLGINERVLDNPALFAVSLGGVGNDAENGVLLAALGTASNSKLGGYSLVGRYDGIVSETMLAASSVKAAAASDMLYTESLQAQRDSISGVNIDEETILMMMYQRMFQANSRIVTIIDEMMATLIAL